MIAHAATGKDKVTTYTDVDRGMPVDSREVPVSEDLGLAQSQRNAHLFERLEKQSNVMQGCPELPRFIRQAALATFISSIFTKMPFQTNAPVRLTPKHGVLYRLAPVIAGILRQAGTPAQYKSVWRCGRSGFGPLC